jgi:NAD(P)-dependent dehydrogenase (short-subunit alcohol dehydrogenase family)
MLTTRLSAVEALAPALALELAPVRVNAVTPALENDVKLDHIRQSIGHADPLTI